VSSLKKNSERIFKELINSYFTDKEASEIQSLTVGNSIKKMSPLLKINARDRRQIETEFPKENQPVSKIDQTILYAKEKLKRKKFLKFLLSIGNYAFSEGEGDLSLEIFEMVIKESRGKPKDAEYQAEADLMIADVYKKKTKWVLSHKYLEKSKEMYQNLKNNNGLAKCSNMLGTIYGEIGDLKKAKSCFEESLDLTEGADDNELRGMVEINLGIINGIFADYQKSRDYFNKALKYFEKTGDKKRLAEIYNNLGMMDYNSGNFGMSLDEFSRSIEVCLKINYYQLLGLSFLGKAITYLKLGNLPLAAALSDKAMTVCNKSSDRLSVADIYKVKGIIARESGRYKESENLLKTSLMINIELGNKLNEAETSVELGRLFLLLDEKRKSTEMFRNSMAYYRSQGSEEKIKEINGYLEI
jgi:tetratricopeptide (TPR) repeat protein